MPVRSGQQKPYTPFILKNELLYFSGGGGGSTYSISSMLAAGSALVDLLQQNLNAQSILVVGSALADLLQQSLNALPVLTTSSALTDLLQQNLSALPILTTGSALADLLQQNLSALPILTTGSALADLLQPNLSALPILTTGSALADLLQPNLNAQSVLIAGSALSNIGVGFLYSDSISALQAEAGSGLYAVGKALADGFTLLTAANDYELTALYKGVSAMLGTQVDVEQLIPDGHQKEISTILTGKALEQDITVNLAVLGFALSTAWTMTTSAVSNIGLSALYQTSTAEINAVAELQGLFAIPLMTSVYESNSSVPQGQTNIQLPTRIGMSESPIILSAAQLIQMVASTSNSQELNTRSSVGPTLTAGSAIIANGTLGALCNMLCTAATVLQQLAAQHAQQPIQLGAVTQLAISDSDTVLAQTATLVAHASELNNFSSLLTQVYIEAVQSGIQETILLPVVTCLETLATTVAMAESISAVKALQFLYAATTAIGVNLNRQWAVLSASLGAGTEFSNQPALQAYANLDMQAMLLFAALEMTERYRFADLNDISLTTPTILSETFITDSET